MKPFSFKLLKYQSKGEKTGWTYFEIPTELANNLRPDCKVSFSVKGRIDSIPFKQKSLIPIGNGNFIFPVNGELRSKLKKKVGDFISVEIELDLSEFEYDEEFLACLEDEPEAMKFFSTLKSSEKKYFSKWISSAKTIETKTKRVLKAINALKRNLGYVQMIRESRNN